MPFARTSVLRSFRYRVMAALFVVVVGTMLITTIIVQAILSPYIHQDFEKQNADEAEETLFDILAEYPDGVPSDIASTPAFARIQDVLNRRARSRGNLHWFVRLYDAKNGLVFESESPLDVPPPTREDFNQPRETPKYAWTAKPWPTNKFPPDIVVQTGRSREGLVEDIALVNQTLFIRGILVILLAPVGGYYLARQVTGPIANIISTASRLNPQQMSERLPIRGVNDELDRVSQTINRMLDRIADYIEKNRAFVANAAHELRSPLAAIRSSAEVAISRSRSAEEYATVLGEMIDEVDRLSSMVNRLLLLAEGDAGRMAPGVQTAQLDKVIRESVDMFRAVAETQQIELDLKPLPSLRVVGDEANLRHVVRNLIDNAIKFSSPGTSVTIQGDADSQHAILTVADRGIGIPPEDVPRLFERFFRGDRSRHRDDGRAGTGLGLSICQAVVAALGGEIKVASRVGEGTTFTVRIPLAKG